MAGKISELTAATSVSASDEFEVLQGGANKRATKAMVNVLQSATVELTDAQIKASPTSPTEMVAAPGANKIIVPISGVVSTNGGGDNYLNFQNEDIVVKLESGQIMLSPVDNVDVGTLLSYADPSICILTPYWLSNDGLSPKALYDVSANLANKSLQFQISNAGVNLTDGAAQNTMKVTVYYVVVDL